MCLPWGGGGGGGVRSHDVIQLFTRFNGFTVKCMYYVAKNVAKKLKMSLTVFPLPCFCDYHENLKNFMK